MADIVYKRIKNIGGIITTISTLFFVFMVFRIFVPVFDFERHLHLELRNFDLEVAWYLWAGLIIQFLFIFIGIGISRKMELARRLFFYLCSLYAYIVLMLTYLRIQDADAFGTMMAITVNFICSILYLYAYLFLLSNPVEKVFKED